MIQVDLVQLHLNSNHLYNVNKRRASCKCQFPLNSPRSTQTSKPQYVLSGRRGLTRYCGSSLSCWRDTETVLTRPRDTCAFSTVTTQTTDKNTSHRQQKPGERDSTEQHVWKKRNHSHRGEREMNQTLRSQSERKRLGAARWSSGRLLEPAAGITAVRSKLCVGLCVQEWNLGGKWASKQLHS